MQLKDFDNLTTQMLTQAEQEVTPQQEINQTHQRLQMKEKQLQELADAMRSYSPTEELYKQYEEQVRTVFIVFPWRRHDVVFSDRRALQTVRGTGTHSIYSVSMATP